MLPPLLLAAWVLGAPPAGNEHVGLDLSDMRFEFPVLVTSRFDAVNAFPVDAEGTRAEPRSVQPLLRLGARFDAKRGLAPFHMAVEYEHDLITGSLADPSGNTAHQDLRKAVAALSLGPYLHLIGGWTTSDFGLGLLANDGSRRWTPGSATFADPRGGDRVLRAALASGPVTDDALFFSLAFDRVIDDDFLKAGDRASQLSAAFVYGRKKPTSFGFYVAHRTQSSNDGESLSVTALDGTAKIRFDLEALSKSAHLDLEGEVAGVLGSAGFGGTADHPDRSVRQLGAALRSSLDAGLWGSVVDLFYGSGDDRTNPGALNAFTANHNYSMGLLLFNQVLAAQTARAVTTASDPTLVGVRPLDLERFPSQGSLSGALAVFPRAFVRPIDDLEIYGGPLLAWTTAPLYDPRNSVFAGGATRNALNGSPGRFLGTELDAGVRYGIPVFGAQLFVGVEGGVLFPGSAFAGADGQTMNKVAGVRTLASYRL